MAKSLEQKLKDYLGRNLSLYDVRTTLYITKLTDKYVELDSQNSHKKRKKSDASSRYKLTIFFDPEDEVWEKDTCLKSELNRIYQWHMKHCNDCIEKREVPDIGADVSLNCMLAELIDTPLNKPETEDAK